MGLGSGSGGWWGRFLVENEARAGGGWGMYQGIAQCRALLHIPFQASLAQEELGPQRLGGVGLY